LIEAVSGEERKGEDSNAQEVMEKKRANGDLADREMSHIVPSESGRLGSFVPQNCHRKGVISHLPIVCQSTIMIEHAM
jgi:hypothetical protein